MSSCVPVVTTALGLGGGTLLVVDVICLLAVL